MFKKQLKELLAFAQATDLQEVLWEKKGAMISFTRAPRGVAAVEARHPAAERSGAGPSRPVEPLLIRSTMVGTFYRSDSSDRPPFVVEGTVVAADQPVAAIEAMKIKKDVLAHVPCRIVKALVANGHPVEYGQPLFQVEAVTDHV